MHLPTGVFLLRMIDVLVEVSLQRPIAAGRIGIQATPYVYSKIGRFLHRLHRFHGARQLPLHLVGQGDIAQPPAPAITRSHMHPHLSGHAARGTRRAQQKRREHPAHHRALAAIQERTREGIAGALATLLFAAVALQARLGVVGAPGPDVVALPAGTLEGPILPAQRMDGGWTRCGVEEEVEMRHHRHG